MYDYWKMKGMAGGVRFQPKSEILLIALVLSFMLFCCSYQGMTKFGSGSEFSLPDSGSEYHIFFYGLRF